MKKFTSILLVIFWSALGRAQNTATLQWNNTIAGTTSGSDNGIVSFTDNAGNTYAAGTNQNGLFVAKFDNTGAVVQHFQHVDTNNTALSPKIIQTDAMNNIYVGGDKFFDGVYQVSFAKFDPTGNLLWMKDYSNAAGFGNIQSISADNNVSPNYFCYTGYVGDSLWVGKFDVTTSDFAWNTKLIPAGYINAKGLHVSIKSSNIYVAGQTMGTFTNDDALLIRFNALGTLTYLTTLNGSASSQDIAYKVIVNSSGEAFLFGTAYNPGLQYFVSKYDIVGGTSWTSYSGVPAGETIAQAHDLAFNATYSKVYALGSSNHAVTNGNGNIMIFTASSGALAHSAVINFGTENEMPKDLIVDNSENYYIVGSKSNGFLGVKYNSSNALSYTLSYTDLNYWLGSHLDLSGNLFICGTASSTVTLGDVVLSKYNSTGLFLWNGIFNDQVSEQDISNGSIMDAGGNLVHFGSSYNSITFLDLSIAKYHANGSTLWHTQLDMGVSFDKIYGYGKDGSDNYFAYTVNAANQANIVKLDNNGNILYNTPLGTQQQNGFSCDLSGNSFVSGPNFTARDNFDITKFGFMNTVIWTTPIIPASITSYTTLYKTIPDNTGNLYALGTKSGFPSGSKLYVEKIDNAGNRIWGTMIGGYDSMSSSFPAQVLLLDNSGDVVIGTTVKKTDGNNALLIAKFDKTTGTVVFNKIFNGTGSDRSESLAGMSIGSSNEVLTAGFFTPPMSLNPIRPVAKKFDTNGNLVWEYINPDPYTTAPSDKFSNIEQDVDGNYIVAGSIFRQLTTSTSETKLLTLKLNSSGNQVWSQLFEPTYNGNGTTTCLNLFQNRIYVSGTSKMSPGLKEDITLLKYCDNAAPNIVESSVIACNGSSVPLTLSSPFSSYSWQPTNETTGSINATATGNYWVIGTETDGCAKISDTVNVTIKDIPVTPEICMVTVDSLSTHNIIYWDKSAFSGISHFVIYREDVTNIYTAVGSVPYDSLSEYHDYGANPNITTKRYKITAVDTCGTESLKSNYHNTLYVTENGLGDFTWNLYEIESSANPVTTFELLRDDNGTGVWNVIGTTAGTQQILSDPTYSTWPNGQWYVRTVWGITCTPTRAGISTSRSNLRTKSMITDIDENHTGVTTTVFPNPAHDNITVLVGNYEGECTVMIKDAAGRVVKQTTFISNTATISLEGIETGIYFIETGNADFLNVSKVIIN